MVVARQPGFSAFGHRRDASVNRWIAILSVSGHPPGVMMVEPVGSYAEADERAQQYRCTDVHFGGGVLAEMSAAGVGPYQD